MDQSKNIYSACLYRLPVETKSQTDQSWPRLSSQNHTRHNPHRNEQHCDHRYSMDRGGDTDSEESSFDMSEYPVLGEKKVKIKNAPDVVVSCQESIVTDSSSNCVKTKIKDKKMVGSNRYKRTEKISFDLKKALESAGYFMDKSAGRSMKLRLEIHKVNKNPTNKNSQNDKCLEMKKIKVFSVKPKRLSSLKKKILLERVSNKQMRWQGLHDNKAIEESITDVNSIDFNNLKIKPDPEMDIDYVKRMSALTVYGTAYRDVKPENIPEDTVQFRPDLTQELDKLRISNLQNRNVFTTSYRNPLDSTDDLMTLQHTLSLKDEDDIDIKPDIKALSDRNVLVRYSKNFREYCNNLVTPSLNKSLEEFLSEIKRLQTKLYDRDQNKGRYKRRYYAGLKEVQKHIELKKVRFVMIAPDIEKIQSKGGLDEEVSKLLEVCRNNEIAFCFGLRRRKLGYYAHGNGLVGCIGIANYGNAELLFRNVLVEVLEARNKFEELQGRSEKMIDVSKIIHENGLLTENIGALLKTLTSIHSNE